MFKGLVINQVESETNTKEIFTIVSCSWCLAEDPNTVRSNSSSCYILFHEKLVIQSKEKSVMNILK